MTLFFNAKKIKWTTQSAGLKYRQPTLTERKNFMKGYVFVNADAVTTKKKLEYWIKLALEYNKIAKPSKKKKK